MRQSQGKATLKCTVAANIRASFVYSVIKKQAQCSITVSPDGVVTFGLPDRALITNDLVSTKHVRVPCTVPLETFTLAMVGC